MLTYPILLHFLETFLNLVLARSFAMELMRQIAESLFKVQDTTIVIDIVKLDVWLEGFLVLEVHNGTSMKAIATSNLVVLTVNKQYT